MMLPLASQLYQFHQIAAAENDVLAFDPDSDVSGSAIRTETTSVPVNLFWCQSITLPFLPLLAHPSGSWVPGGPASLFSEEFSSISIILVGVLVTDETISSFYNPSRCQRFPLNRSFHPEFQLDNSFVLRWRLL
ncbi:hypothetical protein An01g12395 [Aspergillus niger]|uniref:Uncharacterized protein n=2 Tax=Aspergillus niger TaxID=5061 RepID=A2QAQ7_ASPNC|nr:hypothetical protein An01g12395 [Aspergillus niger]CAK37291.1 hypothetical protein An01g12395 [Aspergillus niger]